MFHTPSVPVQSVTAVPLVSVVIPSYNYGSLLPEAVSSALAQRSDALGVEVIVVDDGSEDDTLPLLKAMQAEAPLPLHIVRQGNHGAAAARNAGLACAKGDLIAFLDADDRLLRMDRFRQHRECF